MHICWFRFGQRKRALCFTAISNFKCMRKAIAFGLTKLLSQHADLSEKQCPTDLVATLCRPPIGGWMDGASSSESEPIEFGETL